MSSKKEVVEVIKLQAPAGAANPSPPLGPILGQRKINIMGFCKEFNARTQNIEKGLKLRVEIFKYKDQSFEFVVKTPPTSVMIMKSANVKKGSSEPNLNKVAKLDAAQLKDLAQEKMTDLTALDIYAAMRTIAGSARSMGIETEEVVEQ